MQAICPNPSCGAAYTVSPQHIGKTFPCRSCGTQITVTAPAVPTPAGGVSGPVPVAQPVAMDAPAQTSDSSAFAGMAVTGRALQHKLVSRVRTDVMTWVLGAGVILSVLCMFMPILDGTKVARRQAKITAGDQHQVRADRELNSRVARGGTAPTAAEMEARRKGREEWTKSRDELEDDVQDASLSLNTNMYWYTWGVFAGAVLIAVASLSYMSVGQTRIRRVVGAVLICFLVVMILSSFNLMSLMSSVSQMARSLK